MRPSFLQMNNGNEEVKIPMSSIFFVITSNVTSSLVCVDDTNYTFQKPLSVISSYLPENFFQVNRSCVINLNKVITLKINERRIILSDYKEFNISARRLTALKDALKRNGIFTI